MRADYILREELEHVLATLMPANRLACEVSLATGLRIDDVLSLKTAALAQRMTVTERKTSKRRRVYIPADLYRRMVAYAGRYFVFPNRLDERKHRTRQAVYKDLRRSAELLRIKPHVSPHTCRKVYAVEQYRQSGDLAKVQKLLNHSNEAVTLLYAMADEMTARRLGGKV